MTTIDLNPDELLYNPFTINLHRCGGSFNALDDLSNRICVPSKIKDVNLKVYNYYNKINLIRTISKTSVI